MKAVRIHDFGDRRVLAYEDAPKPEPGPEDLLIRVVGTSINPVDWKIREGHLQPKLKHVLPLTLGWDVSGVVEAMGAEARGFEIGDAVYARPDIQRQGSYAEFIAVRHQEVALKPKTLSHIEAACLPLAGITAWEVLIKTAQVTQGQRVLIHAGSGGVGSLAIQLAKFRGAYVITTASAANRQLLLSLGADEVIDYQHQKFAEIAREVDVVFDTLGGQVQENSWAVLKPGGLLVSIFSPPSQEAAKTYGKRGAFVFIGPDAGILRELAKLADTGKLRPVVGAEFALDDIAKAHALSESGHAVGKIAVYVGRP